MASPALGRVDLRDALFGAFLIAVAGLVFFGTRTLSFGTPADMGAGFMPRVLAGLAAAFGAYFLVRSLTRTGEPIERPQARPLLCLLASIAAFALLGATAGLAVAAFATVLIAALGSRETRPVEIVLFAIAVAIAATALFVKALSLPLPVGPW